MICSVTFACKQTLYLSVSIHSKYSSSQSQYIHRCKICSKLTIITQEQHQWHLSGVFMVSFKHATPFSNVSIVDLTIISWVFGFIFTEEPNLAQNKGNILLKRGPASWKNVQRLSP